MPAYEVLCFTASRTLLDDHDAILPAICSISQADGMLELRYGFAEEDSKTCCIVIKWESVGYHKAIMETPDYAQLLAKLKPVMAGPLQTFHVEFENDGSLAFDAATTGLIWINLKEGKTRADVKTVLYKQLGPELMSQPGVVSGSAAWNATVEDAKKYLLVIGWESSKQQLEYGRRDRFKQLSESPAAVGQYQVTHVPFTTFKKEY